MEITESDIQSLWNGKQNVGVNCRGLVVVDFDVKEAGREFYRKYRNILKTVVETRKGAHIYFRGESRNGKHKYGDIRSSGGQVVAPDSVVKDWNYRFATPLVPSEELPLFRSEMIELKRGIEIQQKAVKDGARYISHIQAISGQGGHNSTFRAACKLKEAGMDEAEALAAMVEWNRTNCLPPWTTKELLHKVRSAFSIERSVKCG